MRVELFRGTDDEWDRFVRAQAGWTHFHLIGWRDVVARVHGHHTPYLVARDERGAMRGILPLVRVSSPVFGRYLVSMPYVNYGGPLGEPTAVAALSAYASAMARDDGALLELRSRWALPIDLPVSHRKITCVLDLPPAEPETLFRSLDANVRRRVRRAQKAGITVAFGAEQIDAFYAVYSLHMRDLGTPTQPRRLFAEIARAFPDDFEIACAYLQGKPIAVLAGPRWDSELEVTWASALVAYKELAANMLVYWALIERCVGLGLSRFNFGRCSPGSGTHRFKRQWGSVDEPLWWYTAGSGARLTTPTPTDARFAWGPRLWKRLPERVATAVGPHVVRFIP
jgi:FemAB-related protein (PEP-CTERM system-associated)